jgi:hypothetical protein
MLLTARRTPDGRRIAFSSERDGQGAVWMKTPYTRRGGELRLPQSLREAFEHGPLRHLQGTSLLLGAGIMIPKPWR